VAVAWKPRNERDFEPVRVSDEWQQRCPGFFQWLPLAAVIEDRIFCVHGGISPELDSLDGLRSLKRPIDIPDEGLLADLLWADPDAETDGYEISERGTSYSFGATVVQEFLDKNKFDLLCRGHQCVPKGYEFPFEDSQSTLTVFSAPNYCGEMGNYGAMLKVDAELMCTFELIAPPAPPPPADEAHPAIGVYPGKP
jgi:serine/threonine-protein phosphatase PP1 catalytic subunit